MHFLLPEPVPASLQLRCRLFAFLDEFASKLGARDSFPGQGMDPLTASLQFIHFKDVLDRSLTASHACRSPGECIRSRDYLSGMLPGLLFEPADTEEQHTFVDPDLVVGASWRHHPDPKNPDEVMDQLNAATVGSNACAVYIRINDLPLYIVGEGNNRVELFRRHRRPIKALVRHSVPKQIPIIRRNLAGDRWVSTWRNEYGVMNLATVPFPHITLPIYNALGVQIEFTRLPLDDRELDRNLEHSLDWLASAVCMA